MVRAPARLLVVFVALAAVGVGSTVTSSASTAPSACGQPAVYLAAMAAPCSEIDRAVHEAAAEFRIDEARFRRMINCESHFVDVVHNGQYIGLAQEGTSFRSSQVPAFDYDTRIPVDLGKGMPGYTGPTTAFSPHNPFHNARLAARVIADTGYGQWQCKGQ